MKKYIFFLLTLICSYTANAKSGDDNNKVRSTLTTVTVYKVGAELTHTAKADVAQGNSQLIIENISNSVDINSIQVNCNGNVTIMGVEFGTDNLQDEIKTPEIKSLEDSVEKVNKNLSKVKTNIDILKDLLGVLKSNREIKGSQTGLSVVELTKLMDYYQSKSISLQDQLDALNDKQTKLTELVDKLTDQIAEEEKKNTKQTGKLILQLNCAEAGKYDFTISYITQNAYWEPFYALKADNIKTPLQIIYRAKIYQTTGIDWKQVKLSLSTSTPNESGNAPTLDAWFLTYIYPAYRKYEDKKVSAVLEGRVAGVDITQDGEPGATSQISIRGVSSLNQPSPLYIIDGEIATGDEGKNIKPTDIKSINVLKDEDATTVYGAAAAGGVIEITLKHGMDDYTAVSDKELNVTFDIDLPYDIPTNGKAQTAELKKYSVPVDYKFFSIPKLDKQVYLLAQISDWEKLNLLPGEANIIFEGTYIGKSFIDPSSTDDTLKLTMGVDKRVVVTREKLMDFSSIKFLGANKKQIFTYETTVKNNKKDAIDISIKDQYPISQNKEIEVELLESKEARVNTETGELNWNLKLAAGEVKKIRISYSIKYPKDKILNLN
ncbi:MAG TPA: mucoidy inhibitor MuiA family protein [Ferruginibacter sp.]|nr:mucoidy inhibitor MuiA family protein [Ferruginibacter sp.]